MADYTFEPELIAAQRDFLTAEARVTEINALMPRPTAIAAGEASIPDELRQAREQAWAEQDRAIAVLYDQQAWEGIPREERVKARMQLKQAARSTPAE